MAMEARFWFELEHMSHAVRIEVTGTDESVPTNKCAKIF